MLTILHIVINNSLMVEIKPRKILIIKKLKLMMKDNNSIKLKKIPSNKKNLFSLCLNLGLNMS